MNKVISFSILYLSLLFNEIVIIFILLTFVALFQYGFDLFYIKGAWRDTGLWSLWRVLFFGLPFIILYFLLFKYVVYIKLYKPLLFSFFNLLTYVLLSVLSRGIWGKNVPLPPEGIMFWVTCVSIIVSPLVLWQFSYFKRLMQTLSYS
jgi:hypothetical protein